MTIDKIAKNISAKAFLDKNDLIESDYDLFISRKRIPNIFKELDEQQLETFDDALKDLYKITIDELKFLNINYKGKTMIHELDSTVYFLLLNKVYSGKVAEYTIRRRGARDALRIEYKKNEASNMYDYTNLFADSVYDSKEELLANL